MSKIEPIARLRQSLDYSHRWRCSSSIAAVALSHQPNYCSCEDKLLVPSVSFKSREQRALGRPKNRFWHLLPTDEQCEQRRCTLVAHTTTIIIITHFLVNISMPNMRRKAIAVAWTMLPLSLHCFMLRPMSVLRSSLSSRITLGRRERGRSRGRTRRELHTIG